MQITIADFFGKAVQISDPKGVAQLAQFVRFDPQDAQRFDTAPACIAVDALIEEYKAHEMESFNSDYYDGGRMTFKDGSEIKFLTP